MSDAVEQAAKFCAEVGRALSTAWAGIVSAAMRAVALFKVIRQGGVSPKLRRKRAARQRYREGVQRRRAR